MQQKKVRPSQSLQDSLHDDNMKYHLSDHLWENEPVVQITMITSHKEDVNYKRKGLAYKINF